MIPGEFAFRQLLTNAGFTAMAVFTLASATLVGGADVSSTNLGFAIQREGERAWLVRPNGERFFSLGVCCVNQGTLDFDATNPSYAAWQHYVDSNLWARSALKRLKTWGFTTVGGWSDF